MLSLAHRETPFKKVAADLAIRRHADLQR